MKTTAEKLRNADFDAIEREVVGKLKLIRAAAKGLDPSSPLSDKIANELFLPALSLLAEFCACVEVTDG